MKKQVLNNPTVAQMIEALRALPQDLPLTIEDADTNWIISIIHITEYSDSVQLNGEYSEMTR